jgi:hypothetical protein
MAQQPSQAIQKLLQKLKNTSEEVSQSLLSEGYQRPWEDPPGWEGDIFNLEGITAAYDRQEANENYQDALKSQRPMGEAMAAGGNRIVGSAKGGETRRLGLQHAIELLAADRADAVLPHLSRLGQQILPLLKVMDKEFGLNLPLADIERRLSQRTRPEEKSGQEIVTSVQDHREGNL